MTYMKRTHCFIDRIREKTSLELVKEIKKDVSRAWDKEKISGSPLGIEPQTFAIGFRAPMS